ncbi:hypothetical protein KEM48_012104 [Puccinia striiformis f. sp. tritici PST-130]|nr:hypothetical protein H4Q26_012936 [Puccinia striiformis f. sp. tritici PST-130]KAI9627642.1 hypothetical protein KEM48_012104 [Puccinia striiformis f. sp. tritici PST-130]
METKPLEHESECRFEKCNAFVGKHTKTWGHSWTLPRLLQFPLRGAQSIRFECAMVRQMLLAIVVAWLGYLSLISRASNIDGGHICGTCGQPVIFTATQFGCLRKMKCRHGTEIPDSRCDYTNDGHVVRCWANCGLERNLFQPCRRTHLTAPCPSNCPSAAWAGSLADQQEPNYQRAGR